jgi:mono/diheme cytochrome c family protein
MPSFDQDQSTGLERWHCSNLRASAKGEHRMSADFRHVLVLLATGGLFGGTGALAADADQGGVLAGRWCASCHAVAGNQKQASADVPPFAAIAQKPDFSEERIVSFLLEPHPKMPSYSLSRYEAANIAAYIGSMRK